MWWVLLMSPGSGVEFEGDPQHSHLGDPSPGRINRKTHRAHYTPLIMSLE